MSATWVVPSLTCAGAETLSSTWVGIGGISGGALLQAGMYDECFGTSAVAGAFAEQYPGSTASFALQIQPGDVVTASVGDTSSGWQATVTDVTTNTSATASAPDFSGGESAAWMTEAFGTPENIPMSNFASETLSAFTVNGAPAQIPESDVYAMANVAPSDPAMGLYRVTYG